jgi:hypothetical protein
MKPDRKNGRENSPEFQSLWNDFRRYGTLG